MGKAAAVVIKFGVDKSAVFFYNSVIGNVGKKTLFWSDSDIRSNCLNF